MPDTSSDASSRWLKRLAILAAIVAVVVALRLTVFASKPVSVRVVAVERGIVESTITNSKAGTVRVRRRSAVTAETGGRVVEIVRREGDRVEKGALLVRLNDATARSQVELAHQGVRVAEANRDEACLRRDRTGRELQRKKQLSKQNIVSDDVLDELQYAHDAAKVACSAAEAERARAEASLAVARTELDKTLILAPFDGVVAEVSTELGEWVTPSPPLLTSPAVIDLIDTRSLYISAPMDEVDSGRIRIGQRVKVSVDSLPDEELEGIVLRVAPYVLDLEAQNRTVEIEVELADGEQRAAQFLPGTSADVEVVLDVHENVLRLPTSALLEGNRVLIVIDGMLEEREVELGLRNWEYAELVSGLEQGQQVVVSLDRVEVEAGAAAVVDAEGSDNAP